MRLNINNFAKIKTADIELNGITVIVGNNNTGKTTVGKVLFSIFNSVYGIHDKIDDSRRREIYSRCRKIIRTAYDIGNTDENGFSAKSVNVSRRIDMASREFAVQLQNNQEKIDNLDYITQVFYKISEKYALPINEDKKEEFLHLISEEIAVVNDTKDYAISLEIIERFFDKIFSHHFCNLTNTDSSNINLKIQNQELKFMFQDKKCIHWSDNFEIMHEAFFVDDPFVVDELDGGWIYPYEGLSTREFLIRKISQSVNDEQENIISSVLAKEKLKDIDNIIENIVPEDIQNKNGEWVVSSDYCLESIHVGNISAGVKSFLVLKILLERGILKEKDVLILDEPEIHLHPEWQIKYAEIIVLLQKMFDLTILVTTHSRDFFEAINLYSKKYTNMDKCKYYLSEQKEDGVEFIDVSDNVSEIYKHLVNPSMLLDKLKFELEDDDNE